MKFHLVKLLLFLSLAASFMLLLKEDISPVQDASCKEPRREWQWPMQIQCISYKACSRAPAPAEAELLATQNAAGRQARPSPAVCRLAEAPFAATGRWECSTPCMSPVVLPVPHSRESPARKRVLDPLTHQEGSGRPNVVISLEFVTADHHSLGLLKSHLTTPGPHCNSPQEAECLCNCQLPYFRAWDCLFCPGLLCKLLLIKV